MSNRIGQEDTAQQVATNSITQATSSAFVQGSITGCISVFNDSMIYAPVFFLVGDEKTFREIMKEAGEFMLGRFESVSKKIPKGATALQS